MLEEIKQGFARAGDQQWWLSYEARLIANGTIDKQPTKLHIEALLSEVVEHRETSRMYAETLTGLF